MSKCVYWVHVYSFPLKPLKRMIYLTFDNLFICLCKIKHIPWISLSLVNTNVFLYLKFERLNICAAHWILQLLGRLFGHGFHFAVYSIYQNISKWLSLMILMWLIVFYGERHLMTHLPKIVHRILLYSVRINLKIDTEIPYSNCFYSFVIHLSIQ